MDSKFWTLGQLVLSPWIELGWIFQRIAVFDISNFQKISIKSYLGDDADEDNSDDAIPAAIVN